MRLNLTLLMMGYTHFRVNGKLHLTYVSAIRSQKAVPEDEACEMLGYHLKRGWLTFYIRTKKVLSESPYSKGFYVQQTSGHDPAWNLSARL